MDGRARRMVNYAKDRKIPPPFAKNDLNRVDAGSFQNEDGKYCLIP